MNKGEHMKPIPIPGDRTIRGEIVAVCDVTTGTEVGRYE